MGVLKVVLASGAEVDFEGEWQCVKCHAPVARESEACPSCKHRVTTPIYQKRWETPREFYDRAKTDFAFYARIGVPSHEYGRDKHGTFDEVGRDSRIKITRWFWQDVQVFGDDENLGVQFDDEKPTVHYEEFRQQINALERTDSSTETVFIEPHTKTAPDQTLTVHLGERVVGTFAPGVWAFAKAT